MKKLVQPSIPKYPEALSEFIQNTLLELDWDISVRYAVKLATPDESGVDVFQLNRILLEIKLYRLDSGVAQYEPTGKSNIWDYQTSYGANSYSINHFHYKPKSIPGTPQLFKEHIKNDVQPTNFLNIFKLTKVPMYAEFIFASIKKDYLLEEFLGITSTKTLDFSSPEVFKSIHRMIVYFQIEKDLSLSYRAFSTALKNHNYFSKFNWTKQAKRFEQIKAMDLLT